jgi:hypothetical protein
VREGRAIAGSADGDFNHPEREMVVEPFGALMELDSGVAVGRADEGMLSRISPQSREVYFLRELTSSTQVRSAVFAWIQGPTKRIELRVFNGRVPAIRDV